MIHEEDEGAEDGAGGCSSGPGMSHSHTRDTTGSSHPGADAQPHYTGVHQPSQGQGQGKKKNKKKKKQAARCVEVDTCLISYVQWLCYGARGCQM